MLLILTGFALGLTVLAFLIPDSFLLNAFILYFVYITLATSWNLVGGYAGLLNLGHGAFFGLGAYGYGFLSIYGLGHVPGMLIGALSASFLAVLMVPTFRLREDYFAVGTLALPPIMKIVFERILGISSIIYLPIAGSFSIYSYYFPALIIVTSAIVIQDLIVRSDFGLTLRAIGNEEDTALSIGIYPPKYKMYALVISAYLAGLAGAFYTYNVGYILPEFVFSFNWSLIPIFMCLLGGRGFLSGPIIGAVVYVVVSQILTFTLSGTGGNLLIFGGIILLAALFTPEGLAPHIYGWIRTAFRAKGGSTESTLSIKKGGG
jgi:branched-chain amino acid transport system permease protein